MSVKHQALLALLFAIALPLAFNIAEFATTRLADRFEATARDALPFFESPEAAHAWLQARGLYPFRTSSCAYSPGRIDRISAHCTFRLGPFSSLQVVTVDFIFTSASHPDFEVARYTQPSRCRQLVRHYSSAALLMWLASVSLITLVRHRRDLHANLCPRCAYPRGQATRCTECGFQWPH